MKTSFVFLAIGLAVGLTFTVPHNAFAKDPNVAVSSRDTDGDGKISPDEWDKPRHVFDKFDFNGDGFITADEFAKKWGVAFTPAKKKEATSASPPSDGPHIADVHMHPHPENAPEDVLTWMDRNNVQWAGLGALTGGRDVREHYREVMGNRYIPFAGQSQLNQIYRDGGNDALNDPENEDFKALMAQMKEDFAAGKLKGIGEIFANARTTSKAWFGRKMKIDAPTNRAMIDLAAQYGGVLTLHVQWDRDSVTELQALAAHNPNGKIIIAHCGSNTSADDIRAILKEHQNLWCDLSARHPPKLHAKLMRKKPEQKIFTKDGLEDDWRTLIEDMPDRFMVGSDVKSENDYDGSIETIRSGLLANLTPDTAEKVAYRNAQALLGLR